MTTLYGSAADHRYLRSGGREGSPMGCGDEAPCRLCRPMTEERERRRPPRVFLSETADRPPERKDKDPRQVTAGEGSVCPGAPMPASRALRCSFRADVRNRYPPVTKTPRGALTCDVAVLSTDGTAVGVTDRETPGKRSAVILCATPLGARWLITEPP